MSIDNLRGVSDDRANPTAGAPEGDERIRTPDLAVIEGRA